MLHLTQPAVTQHIRKLEKYYGCKLIDSSRHSVQITKAGAQLYEYLSLQRANEKGFHKLLHNVVEPLKVGATLSIADYYLPQALIGRMLSGEERIRVIVGNTQRLLAALRSGELDCAFIEGLFDTALFETQVFCQAKFFPVVGSGHPLIGREASLEQLHAYPLALREPRSGTREVFENWLSQQNDTPESFAQLIELGSFVLIKELLRRSQAVTFVYEAVVEQEVGSGQLCPLNLSGFDVTHALRFVCRRGDARHKMLQQFFEDLL